MSSASEGPLTILFWCRGAPTLAMQSITNFCDYFVKKVVSEIRKCSQLQGDFVPLTVTDPLTSPPSEGKTLRPNFPNFCDYFVKKVVSEIRKCQLQGARPSDQGLCLWTPLGLRPQTPLCNLASLS